MELSIKPYHRNDYPLSAVLIKSASARDWLLEIHAMGFSPEEITAYAVPGNTANEIWACLVFFNLQKNKPDVGRNQLCQVIKDKLVIPAFAALYPHISGDEVMLLFKNKTCLFHPEIGLVEFEEEIDWKKLLVSPGENKKGVIVPAEAVFIPAKIDSFQVVQVSAEEALANLEENVFPKKETFNDKPLSRVEKAKLSLLRGLFKKRKGKGAAPAADGNAEQTGKPLDGEVEKSGFLQRLESLFRIKRENKLINRLQLSYEELERRNQKEVEKLLDLFKNNPEEALKYAIPLDGDGTSRGGDKELMKMSKLWPDFSLFGNSGRSSSGGGSILPSEYFNRLNQQYHQTAEELIKKGQYDKAAFIYFKLLKNPLKAAQTLEEGKMYAEAASIYLKHLQRKDKAAEMYEKGNMTLQAIDLYKELNAYEKVGDLYMKISQRKKAEEYYHKVIDEYKIKGQYVKASLLYREKLQDPLGAQDLLMKGWKEGMDAENCLTTYFSAIEDVQKLEKELVRVYEHDTADHQRETFLRVMAHAHARYPELQETTTEMAYEIISVLLPVKPGLVSEIRTFNKKDKNIFRDIVKFRSGKKM